MEKLTVDKLEDLIYEADEKTRDVKLYWVDSSQKEQINKLDGNTRKSRQTEDI